MVENDFINIIKYNTIIAAILSLISVFYTSNEDYNLAGYTVLFMVPMLLYFSKGLKENRVILIFAAVAVLVTMKRGAMLGFSLAIIIYFLTTVKNSLNPKTFLNTVLIAFILVSLAFYFYSSQQEMHENRFTVDQFDPNNEKAGSGRVGLYTALYNEWMSGSAEIIIFGYGNQEDSHRTIFRRTHAHSDIFGYMYNYGLVGLLLIFMLYVKLLSFRSKINRSITNDRSIILIVFVILIAVNFYSGLFRTQEALYLFMILPIVQLNNENSNGSRI
jgi:O-antigen ligase